MRICVYAQRNHFLCGFCEKEMVRQQQKNTEPSHIFFWNTKEEKNSHCVHAYVRYAGRNHSLRACPQASIFSTLTKIVV